MRKTLFLIIGILSFATIFAQDSTKTVAPTTTASQQVLDLQAKLNKEHALLVVFAHATGNDADTVGSVSQVQNDIATFGSKWTASTPIQKGLLIIGLLLAIFFAFTEYNLKPVLRFVNIFSLFSKKTKTTIILLIGLIGMLGISSCKTQSLVGLVTLTQAYVEKHCPSDTTSVNGQLTIHYKCDSLWNTSGIKAKCPTANICVDIDNADILVNLSCPGLVPSVSSLVATPAIKK